jgi:hypothetical protein
MVVPESLARRGAAGGEESEHRDGTADRLHNLPADMVHGRFGISYRRHESVGCAR